MATVALGLLKMQLTLLGSAWGPFSPNKQNFADLMAMYQSISSWQFNNRQFIYTSNVTDRQQKKIVI